MEGGIRESIVVHKVVTKLCTGLEYLGRCITMNNYFSSIPFFVELALKGIYATGTVSTNQVEYLSHQKNTRAFKRVEQGHMEWAMHEDWVISCVMWKDKCSVLLLSMHTTLIFAPCEIRDTLPKRHGVV